MAKRVVLKCYCGEAYSLKVDPSRKEIPRCPSCDNLATSLVLDLFKALGEAENHETKIKSLIEGVNKTQQVTVLNAKDLNDLGWYK